MNLLVLHGPNVNLLGARPGDETHWSLAALDAAIRRRARELGAEVTIVQSNHEGALLDALHGARAWATGVILNPGALAHSSWVLRDAVAGVKLPTLEVHLGDLSNREPWRRVFVLEDVCLARITGKGYGSYLEALDRLAEHVRTTRPPRRARGGATDAPQGPRAAAAPGPKTIGRGATGRSAEGGTSELEAGTAKGRDSTGRGKSIGRGGGEAGTAKATAPSAARGKTLGRGGGAAASQGPALITRAEVRAQVAARLSGAITAQALASWARSQWLELQRGAPVESGQRTALEEILQQLVTSSHPFAAMKDDDLIEMMTQLEG